MVFELLTTGGKIFVKWDYYMLVISLPALVQAYYINHYWVNQSLATGSLGTNFIETQIKAQHFSFYKRHLKCCLQIVGYFIETIIISNLLRWS